MLNMSIILFRYKQFASKIYNAISMYHFLCKLITDLHNSIHFITGLNHMHKSSVRFGFSRFLKCSNKKWKMITDKLFSNHGNQKISGYFKCILMFLTFEIQILNFPEDVLLNYYCYYYLGKEIFNKRMIFYSMDLFLTWAILYTPGLE